MIAILAYPICLTYLVIFFFFPKTATIVLLVLATFLWLYILMMNRIIKFTDRKYSEEEEKLLNKYPLYFRFYFASTIISAFLAVVQMSTIVMAIILSFKQHWLYLIPVVMTYSIFAILRPKLDPLFFLKEYYLGQKTHSRQMEAKGDIDFMITVRNKLWGVREGAQEEDPMSPDDFRDGIQSIINESVAKKDKLLAEDGGKVD